MIISPIKINNYAVYNSYCRKQPLSQAPVDSFSRSSDISFGTRYGKSYINGRKVFHETHFFRKDADWDKSINTIITKFPNGAEIHCHACSDGSEAYTIAISLVNRLGWKKASKFFPIKAYDISPEQIEKNKKNIVGITDEEVKNIKKQLNPKINFEDFFVYSEAEQSLKERYAHKDLKGSCKHKKIEIPQYRVSDKLRKAIDFKVSDINDIDKSEFTKPIVLFARNFTKFLTDEERTDLPNKLSKALPKNSLLLTGTLEESHYPINSELEHFGFDTIDKFNSQIVCSGGIKEQFSRILELTNKKPC